MHEFFGEIIQKIRQSSERSHNQVYLMFRDRRVTSNGTVRISVGKVVTISQGPH